MNKKNFIAYQGIKFSIEWYSEKEYISSVLEYFEGLSKEHKKKLFKLFETIGNFGKIFNQEKFRHEGDQIYVFKCYEDRFLCFFFDGAKIIITNAFTKKTNKLPVREKQKALRYKTDYINKYKKGLIND